MNLPTKVWKQVFGLDVTFSIFQRFSCIALILYGCYSQIAPRKLSSVALILLWIWSCYVLVILLWPRKKSDV
jgi:hypothetical protein